VGGQIERDLAKLFVSVIVVVAGIELIRRPAGALQLGNLLLVQTPTGLANAIRGPSGY
jgi:hypothetical protein